MSDSIFYCKTPITRQGQTPLFVGRLKKMADFIKKQGTHTIIKSTRTSSINMYELNGVVAVYDTYYDDKTITVENVGAVHLSMDRSESYFDINIPKLVEVENALGIVPKDKKAA